VLQTPVVSPRRCGWKASSRCASSAAAGPGEQRRCPLLACE
jgi:hypothetical protein